MPADQIRLYGTSDRYNYDISPDTVSVVVQGLSEDLDQLELDGFDAQMDVSDMGPGIHSGTLEISLSSAYELVSTGSVTVNVSEIGPDLEEETEGETEEGSLHAGENGADDSTGDTEGRGGDDSTSEPGA